MTQNKEQTILICVYCKKRIDFCNCNLQEKPVFKPYTIELPKKDETMLTINKVGG